MINGIEYAFQDVKVQMLGKPVIGCTGVEYTTKREKVNIMARGSKPVARGRGPKNFEGKIMVLQSELEALQVLAGAGNDITNIGMFDVVIAYAPDEGGVVKVDTLVDCEFTEVKKGLKTGDMNMEVELPLIIGDIKYNQ